MPKFKEVSNAVISKFTGASPVEQRDSEMDAALERQRYATAKGLDLDRDIAEAHAAIEAADQRVGESADDDDLYLAAKAELAAAEDHLERLNHKKRSNQREQHEAQKAIDVLNRDRVKSVCSRKMKTREKHAQRLVEIANEFGDTWRLFFSNSAQLHTALPPGMQDEGVMLRQREIEDAFAIQLLRSHVVELGDGAVAPLLPGALQHSLLDSKKLPRFDDLVKEADAYLLRLIEARGQPDPVPIVQFEPRETEEGARILNPVVEEMPSGQTHNAASVPMRRVTLYDDSEGREKK